MELVISSYDPVGCEEQMLGTQLLHRFSLEDAPEMHLSQMAIHCSILKIVL